MITLNDVTFAYPFAKPVIRHLSATFRPGERYRITGASGQGKTTLLRLITGLEKPKKGTITRAQGLRFSVVFQEDRLIKSKTVLENVALFAPPERAGALLQALWDDPLEDRRPDELSGGMKRLVALARALAHESDVLILDEAFTGLDDETRRRALRVTETWLNGRTLLLVDHDDDVAQALKTVPFTWLQTQKNA